MFWGVYTVLGETTRNPTNTMIKPLDSNRAVEVVERCMSCLVSRSISNIRVVYALARRQKLGFIGEYLFFLFLIQNIDCGYS